MTDRKILVENLNSYFDGFWRQKCIDIETDFKSVPTNKYNACMIYIFECYVKSLEIYNPSKGLRMYSAADYVNLLEWYITKSLDYDFISLYGFALLINRTVFFLQTIKNSVELDHILDSFVIEAADIDFFGAINITDSNINNTVNSVVYSNTNNCISNNNSIDFDNLKDSEVDYFIRDREKLEGESLRKKVTLPLYSTTLKLFEYIQAATVSKLNDSNVGLIVNANNNKDVGLMYAKETAIEVQKARQKLSLSELPQLD